VLHVMSIDGVEDPIESNDGINHYGGIIPPSIFEAQCVSQERMFCVRVHQTPVHDNIPDTNVNGVDGCPKDEQNPQFLTLVMTPQTQAHIVENGA
ncbi:hypothetical protein M438DRAFT_269727, partial [Aureobasidium pullulans EXF-150]